MNNLKIKVTGSNKNELLLVDNKIVKYKRNNFGTIEADFQTEKSQVEVRVVRYLEITRKHWFWWQVLYFFISIFGIFDVKADKKCVVMDCHYLMSLNGDCEMKIQIDSTSSEPKVLAESNTEFQEIKNHVFVDKTAKKRLKGWRAFKIVLWIALAIGAVALALMSF